MSSWFIPYYFAEKDSLYVMFFKEMFERKKKPVRNLAGQSGYITGLT